MKKFEVEVIKTTSVIIEIDENKVDLSEFEESIFKLPNGYKSLAEEIGIQYNEIQDDNLGDFGYVTLKNLDGSLFSKEHNSGICIVEEGEDFVSTATEVK